MDWEILKDVIAQEALNPSGGAPHLPPEDLDEETIEFLTAEVERGNVIIDKERDVDLSLTDVENHPLTLTLSPHLRTLLEIGNPTWFCSNVIDGYMSSRRALIEAVSTPSSLSKTIPHECELCERPMPLTQHHLYPRSEHPLLIKRGIVDKHTLLHTFAYLCRPCHSAVHRQIDSPTLARDYHSVEALLTHEGIQRWVAWAARQKCVHKVHQRYGLTYSR